MKENYEIQHNPFINMKVSPENHCNKQVETPSHNIVLY